MSLTKRQLRQTRHVREKGHWNFFCQLIAGGIAVAESSCSTGVNGSRQARLKIENQYNYRNGIGGSPIKIDFERLFQKKSSGCARTGLVHKKTSCQQVKASRFKIGSVDPHKKEQVS